MRMDLINVFVWIKNKSITIILILCNIFAPSEYIKSDENIKGDIRNNQFEKILRSNDLVKIGLESIIKKNTKMQLFLIKPLK